MSDLFGKPHCWFSHKAAHMFRPRSFSLKNEGAEDAHLKIKHFGLIAVRHTCLVFSPAESLYS